MNTARAYLRRVARQIWCGIRTEHRAAWSKNAVWLCPDCDKVLG